MTTRWGMWCVAPGHWRSASGAHAADRIARREWLLSTRGYSEQGGGRQLCASLREAAQLANPTLLDNPTGLPEGQIITDGDKEASCAPR